MRAGLKLGVVIGLLTVVSITVGWFSYPQQAVYDEDFEENFVG